MRFTRSRRLPSLDFDHMKALHEECVEQLQLMNSTLAASNLASGNMRDTLDDIVQAHWNAYIETIHLLCMHDEITNNAIKKIGLDLRVGDDLAEPQYQNNRPLISNLVQALSQLHQRMITVYKLHNLPGRDYLKESAEAEQEYVAAMIEMIHTSL